MGLMSVSFCGNACPFFWAAVVIIALCIAGLLICWLAARQRRKRVRRNTKNSLGVALTHDGNGQPEWPRQDSGRHGSAYAGHEREKVVYTTRVVKGTSRAHSRHVQTHAWTAPQQTQSHPHLNTHPADADGIYASLTTDTSRLFRTTTLREIDYTAREEADGGYGFTVVGPLTHADIAAVGNGIFVATVDPYSEAANSGVQPGLQLLSIERRPTAAMTIDALPSLFSRAGSMVSMSAILNLAAFREREALQRYMPTRKGVQRAADEFVLSPDTSPLPTRDGGEIIYAGYPVHTEFGDEDESAPTAHAVPVAATKEPIYAVTKRPPSWPPPLPARDPSRRPSLPTSSTATYSQLEFTAWDTARSSFAEDETSILADSTRSSHCPTEDKTAGERHTDGSNHGEPPQRQLTIQIEQP